MEKMHMKYQRRTDNEKNYRRCDRRDVFRNYKIEFLIASRPHAPMRYRIKAIIHPSKYGLIMNSLITDSYLLSITRNPHISRAASRRAFAFAAPRIYSRSTRCANTVSDEVPRPSRYRVSGRCVYLPVAHNTRNLRWLQDYVLTPPPLLRPSRSHPRESIRHANASDWIFEGTETKTESHLGKGWTKDAPGTLRSLSLSPSLSLCRETTWARARSRAVHLKCTTVVADAIQQWGEKWWPVRGGRIVAPLGLSFIGVLYGATLISACDLGAYRYI